MGYSLHSALLHAYSRGNVRVFACGEGKLDVWGKEKSCKRENLQDCVVNNASSQLSKMFYEKILT